ncbi:TPA: hypothetical protein DEP21_05965 [Patescibacteria group bacterium]|nr:hypothetical protein [Candidatus Gracilibacteria bacterium]
MSSDPLDTCSAIVVEDYQTSSLKSTGYKEAPPYSTWIMDVKSLDFIPTNYYQIDWKYQSAYKHLKQPDATSCSWTSYVMALGNIINAKWGSYPVTSDKVYEVKKKCSNSNGILALERYCEKYHSNYVDPYLPSIGTNKTVAIKQMLNHLLTNRSPFLAIHSCHRKDGDLVGHFVVIHAVNWKRGGRGSTILYSDPAKKAKSNYQDNLYEEDLYDFFSEMLVPDQVRNYNFLFLVPNRY